jgi:hypothetical protein
VTVVQTVLVFGAIPLGVVALLTLAVYGKSLVRQPNRYRPGRPWDYPPSWYVPHPDAVVARPRASGSTTAVGGASGEW